MPGMPGKSGKATAAEEAARLTAEAARLRNIRLAQEIEAAARAPGEKNQARLSAIPTQIRDLLRTLPLYKYQVAQKVDKDGNPMPPDVIAALRVVIAETEAGVKSLKEEQATLLG